MDRPTTAVARSVLPSTTSKPRPKTAHGKWYELKPLALNYAAKLACDWLRKFLSIIWYEIFEWNNKIYFRSYLTSTFMTHEAGSWSVILLGGPLHAIQVLLLSIHSYQINVIFNHNLAVSFLYFLLATLAEMEKKFLAVFVACCSLLDRDCCRIKRASKEGKNKKLWFMIGARSNSIADNWSWRVIVFGMSWG